MSAGVWVKPRKPMSKYPKTPQQKNVKAGGELIRIFCTGKKGTEFRQCRVEVLKCAFDDNECTVEALKAKRDVIKKLP
jgi:hypothetical protein